MSRRTSLVEAWTRFGTDVLTRVPGATPDARRWLEAATMPQRMVSEMHEAWLESLGGVSKNRYLKVVEENLELRRRLEALEKRNPAEESAVAATEAVDGAFRQFRDAQEQWMAMWLPPTGAKKTLE